MPKPKISSSPGYPPSPYCSSCIVQNEMVGADGSVKSGLKENEDRLFHCICPDNGAELYMVLDGHDGTNACDFVKEALPGELFNRLGGTQGRPDEVRRAIHDTFLEMEKRFFLSLDHFVTQKLTLQFELGEMSTTDARKRFPDKVEQIELLDRQIMGGTSVVMALLFHGALYVANVGDARALLCQLDGPNLRVRQLSEDHTVGSESELNRLAALGLKKTWLKQRGRLGPCKVTRSIGDYVIKGGYVEMAELRQATREPGTAEPYISPTLALRDVSRGFLALMSTGLYKAYQSTYPPEHLGQFIAMEMKALQHTSFAQVAQSTISSVRASLHVYCKEARTTEAIDDMSLVIRNFGFDVPMDALPPSHYYPRTMSMQGAGGHHLGTGMLTPTTAPILASEVQQFRWSYGGGVQPQHNTGYPMHTEAPPYGTLPRRMPPMQDSMLGSPTSMSLSASLGSLQLGEALHGMGGGGMSSSMSSSQLQLHRAGMVGRHGPGAESPVMGPPHPQHYGAEPPHPLMGPHPTPSSSVELQAHNAPAVQTPHTGNMATPSGPSPIINTNPLPNSAVLPKPTPPNPPSTQNVTPLKPQPKDDEQHHHSDNDIEGRTLTRQDGVGEVEGGGGDSDDGEQASIFQTQSDPEEESNDDGKIKPYITFNESIPTELSFDNL